MGESHEDESYRKASDLYARFGDVAFLEPRVDEGSGEDEGTESLLGFASDLARVNQLGAVLEEALSKYLDLLQCEAGSLYVWDANTETLVLKVAVGPEREQRIGLRQKLGEGLAGWVAEVGEPILVTDTRDVHRLQGRTCRRYRSFSCLAAPVLHEGKLLGVVCLTMPREDKQFQSEDLYLVQVLSQKLGAMIQITEKGGQVDALHALGDGLLHSIPLSVIAYDRDLRVRFSNLAGRSQFGIQPHDVPAGAPLEEGIGMDRAEWDARLRKVIMDGVKARFPRVDYRMDGQKRILDIHCSPLRDSTDAIVGGVLTVHDVTEDVEREAKLSQAERLALVGKIAAEVAHELNNPLDGILRFLNLALRQVGDNQKVSEYLGECRTGLLRMSSILSQLLTFSRSQRSADRPSSVSQIIHQSLAMYEQRAAATGVELKLDIPACLPACAGHEVWDAFGNVVKNSLDAMPDGGELAVNAAVEGDNVVIHISDNGPGVPEELREKIFEPFVTTKKNGSGVGLGLAVCREYLHRIGGSIELLPSDTGATFRIVVPIEESSE